VAGTIALDAATVREVAAKLVRAHADLTQVQALTVEGGADCTTAKAFRRTVDEIAAVHNANRDAVVLKLAALSQQLRASAADFAGLEEEYRSGLFALESEAFALAQAAAQEQAAREARQAEAASKMASLWGGLAPLLGGSSSQAGGSAPAGSAAEPDGSGI
jgi:hypothetical protein